MNGMKKMQFLVLSGVLILASGCVSSSKYRSLENQAQNDREKLESQIIGLQGKNTALERKNISLEGEIGEFQRDLDSRDRKIAELQNRVSLTEEEKRKREEEIARLKGTYENLVDDLKSEIAEGEIKVTQIQDKLSVNLVEKVLFDSGRSQVNPKGEEILNKVGTILKKVTDKEIRIEGYTDNVPIGGNLQKRFPTNWELSSQRATNVLRFLQEKTGLEGERLSTVGYGEFRPLASNETLDGRAQNRRIEIVLVPKDLRKVPQETE